MKNAITHVVLLLCIVTSSRAFAQFQYISPLPGAKFVTPESNIILHLSKALDPSIVLAKRNFVVRGSQSGKHDVEIRLLENGTTIALQPVKKFLEGETVTVSLSKDIDRISGNTSSAFRFQIRQHYTDAQRALMNEQIRRAFLEQEPNEKYESPPTGGESVSGLPDFTISTNTNPSPGDIFFSHFDIFTGGGDTHYCIIDNNGDSVYGKYDTVTFNNFYLNRNGYLTVYNRIDSAFAMLDSNYNQIAEYQMGNGYKSDVHEFQMYPDGTHWMMCYDAQIIDMTVYNQNYCSNATVIGCVFQKLDKNNNVLFQWRSWDHYSIFDADHVSFNNCVIDYVHANTIELDNDGNILLCCRNMSEITKINSVTGAIIWRMGGLNNQFTFINDPDGISYQHDVKRIANGNITVYDNGNFHTTAFSTAKEYTLDEVNKKATLVWSYKRTINGKNVFAKAMGSVQRLSNGNTFICWGLLITQPDAPDITEVDPAGNIVWEMALSGDFTSHAMYRAHRRDWTPCSRPTGSLITVTNISSTTAKVNWEDGTGAISYDLQYKRIDKNKWKLKTTTSTKKKLKNLDPNSSYIFQVRTHCANNAVSGWTALDTFTTLPQKELIIADEKTSFDLYPNPASSSITISTDLLNDEKASIEIYDVTGKKLYSAQQSVSAGFQETKVDVSKFPGGIYVAEIRTAEGENTQKFLKQ